MVEACRAAVTHAVSAWDILMKEHRDADCKCAEGWEIDIQAERWMVGDNMV